MIETRKNGPVLITYLTKPSQVGMIETILLMAVSEYLKTQPSRVGMIETTAIFGAPNKNSAPTLVCWDD